MRTSTNPMLRDSVIENVVDSDGVMTIGGTINKTIMLLALAALSGSYTWYLVMSGFMDKAQLFMCGGALAGFIFVILSAFKPKNSMILSIGYALSEGLFLGAISAAFMGVALQAVIITFLTLFVMLFLYKIKVLRATPFYKKFISVALISIMVFYLLNILGGFFHLTILAPITSLYYNPLISLAICLIAAFCFIGDFDRIEKFSQSYVPNYFEWYFGMSLMVTIVWLYIEVLKLLSILNRR